MAKVIDVARYLIHLRNIDEENKVYYPLSNLKLQKLLYYCQGAHYKWDSKRLITDKYFELWSYGAVIEDVYKKFSKYGQNDVHINEKETKKIKLSIEERETIESVWKQLRDFHSFDLVKSMLDDFPHKEAARNEAIFIKEDDIESFFANN